MIDSINFVKYGVEKLDTERLMDLGIVYHKLQYRNGKFGKSYVTYGNVQDEIDDYLISRGIGFEYKNVHFIYLEKFKSIILITNAHKVLQKSDICLSDRDLYIDKINEIVKQVLNIDYSQLSLYRIDYCVDLELDYKTMYEYLHLLNKHKSTYGNIKRINEYETSIYLTSQGGQKRINIYDKYKCEKDKYYAKFEKSSMSLADYEKKNYPYYLYYKNIFRIEVQNTKQLIQSERNKIKNKYDNKEKKTFRMLKKEFIKREKLIQRNKYLNRKTDIQELEREKVEIDFMIENFVNENRDKLNEPIEMTFNDSLILGKSLYMYWNKESMGTYFFDFLKDFLYTGTYYKTKIANKEIKKSQYSDCEKKNLKEFAFLVNKYGISNVTKSNIQKQCNHSKWCRATVKKYIDNLDELGIDLIHLDKAQNKQTLKIAKDKINKSKHTKSWKEKLKDFATVVNDFGVADTIAKENKEIAEKSKNSKHHKYSYKTVENYIKMLETLGINPVTIDNNSEFDTLESLYVLIEKVAQEKYFDIDNLEIPEPTPKSTNENQVFRKRKMIGGF